MAVRTPMRVFSGMHDLPQQCAFSPLCIFLCIERLAGVENILSHILHVIDIGSSLFFFMGGDSSELFSYALFSCVGVGVFISREVGISGKLNGNWSGGVINGNCNV